MTMLVNAKTPDMISELADHIKEALKVNGNNHRYEVVIGFAHSTQAFQVIVLGRHDKHLVALISPTIVRGPGTPGRNVTTIFGCGQMIKGIIQEFLLDHPEVNGLAFVVEELPPDVILTA